MYLQKEVSLMVEDLCADLPEELGLLARQEVVKRPRCRPAIAWLAMEMYICIWGVMTMKARHGDEKI